LSKTILMRKESGTGIEVTCSNPKCGYTWTYKGRLQFASCPSCRRLNNLRDKSERLKRGRPPKESKSY